MTRRRMGSWFIALVFGVVLAAGLSQASAQYPPVTGSLVLGAGDATPDLGGEVAVTATLLDEEGSPLAGVACTFGVAEQPGSDASVAAGPFTTDANGNVSTTLSTGSTAGTIVVEADCGELSAAVSVVAGAAAGPGAAEPPASLPETGAGAGDRGMGWAFWALIAGGAFVGAGGLLFAWRRVRA